MKVQKQNGQAIFELEVRKYEVQSSCSYLLKLDFDSSKEVLQSCFDDCYSTSGPHGMCEDALLALNQPESF